MLEHQDELTFEQNFVDYLSGQSSMPEVNEPKAAYIAGKRSWEYLPDVHTTEALWTNFKQILEQHNQASLDHPLSENEFAQVKKEISDLKTPYQAGQFLYGLNGVSQVEVDLDDGRHVYLTVFDQRQIGAGDTVYQVVKQIERQPVLSGKEKRRFDTTLLINGLPIIQIEEKTDAHDVNEALNQMEQYINEAQYSDIYSTLQILVALTPHDAKYMANTTAERFNKDFAFNWQTEKGEKVRGWKKFCDLFLSIPMAHQMATNYMILDGTKNKQMLKVMRPYQVYATRAVIDGIKKVDFENRTNKVGYIWHTTGSGKTITSFKTAWLASRLPNVDKVVFLVDRIALTNQTLDNYRAYDPDAEGESLGTVADTANTYDLSRKLRSKDNGIIVTSVQKLETLIKRKNVKLPDKNIVFIVDEAHRSTGGDAFALLQKAFPHSAWVGYTGTPMFDDKKKDKDQRTSLTTQDIFGDLLHAYTIKQAIADGNVLGFKVDFETTIDTKAMREEFLPQFYHEKYPEWTDQEIKDKIAHLSDDDMDDNVQPSFYDNNKEHVEKVVEDIFKKWRNRSNNNRYNAMLTTHVHSGASTKMAMMYFDEFQRINEEHRQNGGLMLKVAVTFSQDTSNGDNQLQTNLGLDKAIKAYNETFGTSFDMTTVKEYTQDVMARLNKSAQDGNYLDLVIVVDQLLTGFDAPELNTLYVDRTLKGAYLIQAYSRTNRIADLQEKPWGRVINYRWPKHNEKLMDEALAIYADIRSADIQTELVNVTVVAPEYKVLVEDTKKIVSELRNLTNDFTDTPKSETMKLEMLKTLRKYNSNIAKLKQYTQDESEDGTKEGFDYHHPEKLLDQLDITVDEETTLTTTLANQLKREIAKTKHVPTQQIKLNLTHIKEVEINYDYLDELWVQLMNEVHEHKQKEAEETSQKIHRFADALENQEYANDIRTTAKRILTRQYPPESEKINYPVTSKDIKGKELVDKVTRLSQNEVYQAFINQWGLNEAVSVRQLAELISTHVFNEKDLDNQGQLKRIVQEAGKTYQKHAQDPKVKGMFVIVYLNKVRDAVYELADKVVGGLLDE